MGVLNTRKDLSQQIINCGGTFNVRLSFSAEPNILTNPTDIVLVLDRSGSMLGSPLANLKSGAKKFIKIIEESTDGTIDGQIGNGSRIGIVSFSSTATKDTALITSVDDLNAAVDSLSAGGNTNHADAFTKAIELFDQTSSNAKVIVLFTDGRTTIGPDPNTVATLAKNQGIIIYSIGLIGDTGIDINALNNWSSSPSSAYVSIAPDDSALEDLFETLAKNISKPGATNIEIIDTVNSCFKITDIVTIDKGTAQILNDNSIKWQIDELGTSTSEGAVLEFSVIHIGPCTGKIEVNTNLQYQDTENNFVSFPSPLIDIECQESICLEECREAKEITINNCEDSVEYDAGDIYLDSLGRILEINATIKNVCPNRRVALAVILTEVDNEQNEYKRGMKTMVIPAHSGLMCKDIKIRCIRFILPESLDLNNNANSICKDRKFKARFISHYIDNDLNCQNIIQ